MSGGYGDSYSGTTNYGVSNGSWRLTEGSGEGSGSVTSSRSSSVDATAYIGLSVERSPTIYSEPPIATTYVKHYASGGYTSSDATSKNSNFTASFSVDDGEWKTVFEGTDHEDTLRKYNIDASGEFAYSTHADIYVAKRNERSVEEGWPGLFGQKRGLNKL